MLLRILAAASLVGGLLPLASHGQTTPAPSRFYVGVAGNQLSNVPLNEGGVVPRLLGPSLTAGLQLTPRLAVQTGISYHWKKEAYDSLVAFNTKYFIVPVLVRYILTEPTERFHFDILGGATLIHATSHITYVGSSYESNNADTRFNFTLGPAVRAALSPRVELTASGLVSAVVGEDYYKFSDRLFLNTSLGVNYTFGSR